MPDSYDSLPGPARVAASLAALARRAPDSLAVCDVRREMTAGELAAVAGATAQRVVEARRADPSDWLPVIVDRSVESAAALHAAVWAGVPFVPIDAGLPNARVEELLGRLGHPAHALVAKPDHATLLPATTAPIALHEAPGGAFGPQPVDPEALGSVVFTSGSTGRPKGVVRRWSALERGRTDLVDLGFEPSEGPWRVALLRPFSFAAGLGQIATMAKGQSVHIADPASMGADALLDWLRDQRIDVLSMGATLAASLVRASRGQRRLPDVHVVRLGTEATSWELVEPVRALLAEDVTILCGFGATEASAGTRYVVGPDHPVGTGRIPMGRPEDPSKLRLEPVDGVGSPTQLLIADPRAVEYLGDPELTARRFVTDADGRRWWLSGDVVHVDDDGVYHHHGRIDEMVKINGLLVEPREAEEVLRAMPGIGNAAVLAHRTPSGGTRLVGHVVVTDPALNPEGVRSHLEATLPRHLVPAVLMRHDDLPPNDRGKLDRVRLQSMEVVRWRSTAVRSTAVELEVWLCGQVSRILDLGDVGPDDDIWQLGIDSLGAVELCASIDDAGYGTVDPTALLTHRTPTALARRLAATAPMPATLAVVLNPGGSSPPLFAIPGGGGTALAFQALAQRLGADQPLVVVEPEGLHRRGRPDRTIDALAARALDEIDARHAPDAPCVLLGFSAGGTVAYEVAQRLHRRGRAVHLVLLDAAPVGRPAGPRPAFRSRDSVAERLTRRRQEGLVRAVPAIARERVRRLRVRWLARFPGAPSHDVLRYQAFQLMIGRALAGYQPEPAPFPVTLVHVEGNDLASRCAPLMPHLRVHVAGGEHLTMLQPPHVEAVAAAVSEAIATASPPGVRARDSRP